MVGKFGRGLKLAVGQVNWQIKLCQFFSPRYQIKLKIMYSCKHDVLLRNCQFLGPSSMYSISCWLATTTANRLDSYTHMQCMFINQWMSINIIIWQASKQANIYTHTCNAVPLVWDSLRLAPNYCAWVHMVASEQCAPGRFFSFLLLHVYEVFYCKQLAAYHFIIFGSWDVGTFIMKAAN